MLLKGLKVVELATWIAAPACAMIMGEWGADVIKVESAAGDAVRAFYPDTEESPGNPIYSMENRGKRGVVLDITQPAGREAMVALMKAADVFVTNMRPGPLKRARLDYASIKDEAPHLVYASVTGFGLEGEDIDAAAFDMTAFWNRSGAAAAFNPPHLEPLPSRPAFGDHLTGVTTLSGVLAALYERTRTGKGQLVEASLLRTGVYALAWDMSCHLRYGETQTAGRKEDRPLAMTGYFRTADQRWIFTLAKSPICLPTLLKAIGRGDLADHPRYAYPIMEIERVRELRAVIEDWYAVTTLEAAGELLTANDLAWAPLASLDEVVSDPQAWAAGCFVDTPDGWGGGFAAPASPLRFPGAEMAPPKAAPRLGEHTRQVLAEAGYGEAAIEAMLAAGAAVQGEASIA